MHTYLPEPLYNITIQSAVFQLGIIHPVVHIHRPQPRNNQLQLSLVKQLQQVRWEQFVESFLQRQELLVYAHLESPLDVEVDIVFFVFVGDWDVLTVGLEIIVCDSAKSVVFYAEGAVKHTIYVVFTVGGREGGGREGEGGRGGEGGREGGEGKGGRGEGGREGGRRKE